MFKSEHRHPILGETVFRRTVWTKQLPAGLSTITIRARVKGRMLPPDAYRITGRATNLDGTGAKKVRLVVVKP